MLKRRNLPYLICLVLVLAPFVWLALHSMASSDDYYDYMLLQKHGMLGALRHYYLHWSGRLSSYALIFLLRPLAFGEIWGPAIAGGLSLAMLLATCAMLAAVYAKVLRHESDSFRVFVVFSIFLLLYVPRPVELLFWFTASMAYLSGLFFLSAWLYLHFCSSRARFITKLLYVVLPFWVCTGSEINILLMALVFTCVVNRSCLQDRWFMGVLIAFVAGSALELTAPGSKVRLAFFAEAQGQQAGNLHFAISESLSHTAHYLRDWSRSTPLLLMALLLPLLNRKRNDGKLHVRGLIQLLLAALCIPALLFPFFYGTGLDVPPDRLLNVVFIFLSALVFVGLGLLLAPVYSKIQIPGTLVFLLLTAVIWQASYQSRLRTALFDIEKLPAFNAERRLRTELTRRFAASTPNDTLVLPPIKAIPYTIFYGDLQAEPGHWFNEGYASYHGIKAVVCKSSTP